MKPSLQLRISQNLTMTPQLQQAIRLLQLSSMELQTEIQDILESNMMLEVDEGEDLEMETASDADDAGEKDDSVLIDTEDIPEDLPVDSAWEDIYDTVSIPAQGGSSVDTQFLDNQGTQEQTLQDHLLWQLNLTPMSEQDRAIAVAIIDSLDEDGYLHCTLEEIMESLGNDHEVELEEIETVLHHIQAMEPAGVGARNLQECLLLQIDQMDQNIRHLSMARELVSNYLPLIGSCDFNQLMRRLKIDSDTLQDVISFIQKLNPKPGSTIQSSNTEYIIPDVYVKKEKGAWKVELNTDSIPQLKINTSYANMIRRADNSSDNTSLKNHLQEARWFIKSLQSRSETLLRVASCIVEKQRAFLEHGEEAMKPMVLHDIAEQLDMHESTISRVTTRKYMHTPRGIYELKYFFSSHVNTDQGGACSSTAIRAHIKKLISDEPHTKPLSDSKIAQLLSARGIQVARRTVAKYRESMSIPPSNERKRLS